MTSLLISDFLTGLMIFVRIGAMFLFAPLYSNTAIPNLLRLSLALVVTYIVFFNVSSYPFKETDSLIYIAIFAIKEAMVGITMAFVISIVFQGISFAGLLVGRDMGLAMSSMFDPVTGDDGNIIATLLSMAAVIVFILIDGHHFIIESIAYSFKVIPLGGFKITQSALDLIIKFSGSIFILAIKISSPILVAFFLIHLASAIIARVSPSFQVFFVLLPLKIGLGLFLVALVMPLYIYLFRTLIYDYENKLFEIVKALAN
ncbi:MAG: flagellar biosynthetic protein FliR [Ignavibacteriales bacterium]|nr:flagellar biosynthetic protein FliR [Ignavibacteriales bacterium]MBK7980576.1 flagellar biosynthetic protein FliR [Ignavibacteriota bacterium]